MSPTWKPIEPLSDEDRNTDLKDIESLKEAWAEVKTRLGETSKENLQKFSERLARLWSIETGILERLYDVDRGTTAILVEQGFVAAYIDRSGTDQDPEHLIEILRDHKATVELIQDCVANSRPLTIGFIHELHSILTQHQANVSGVDQFGKRVSFPLLRGRFKESPNNPTRENGTVHEYCPPIHVPSDMDRLLVLYSEYDSENPVLLSAWLHHRFEQIHPYQDGNGRVGRALSNLVLVKAGLFPVVVKRDQRGEYIHALEEADAGNLHSLTRLFANIQKKTILEAISVAPDTK
ncbi:MAG: Fic family protein, partial [Terriglobia bacterium]